MDPVTICTIIMAAIALVGLAVALFRWVAKVDENTRATERLTTAFDAFTAKIEERVLDHEKRITRLEAIEEHER